MDDLPLGCGQLTQDMLFNTDEHPPRQRLAPIIADLSHINATITITLRCIQPNTYLPITHARRSTSASTFRSCREHPRRAQPAEGSSTSKEESSRWIAGTSPLLRTYAWLADNVQSRPPDQVTRLLASFARRTDSFLLASRSRNTASMETDMPTTSTVPYNARREAKIPRKQK
ncbi:hypothetical protein H2200_002558 [Cladophialophora chaetospira]|uniref:Uncharacterized protein n=1 Tax=Cladophialophora chaetospira TaxID=386627 RepID=A0AA39CN70_9EURO|nr:hypothetical protein H2200_002558 [Cladophialophora chaetospira]